MSHRRAKRIRKELAIEDFSSINPKLVKRVYRALKKNTGKIDPRFRINYVKTAILWLKNHQSELVSKTSKVAE